LAIGSDGYDLATAIEGTQYNEETNAAGGDGYEDMMDKGMDDGTETSGEGGSVSASVSADACVGCNIGPDDAAPENSAAATLDHSAITSDKVACCPPANGRNNHEEAYVSSTRCG